MEIHKMRKFIIIILIALFATTTLTACGNEGSLIEVPDIVGMRLIDAESVMNDLSLILSYSEELEADEYIIFEISPPSGTQVKRGSTVRVTHVTPLYHESAPETIS